MFALARRTLLTGLAVFLAALGLFTAVAGFSLWPRISGQRLPFSLIWPFARPLLAAGLEVAFLLSVPVALALVFSRSGARPPSATSLPATLFATGLLLVELGLASFAASSWLEGRGSSPGELATELVATARRNCAEDAPPARVTVPLLGFAWTCEAGHAPRLEGHAPVAKQALFRAASIALSDDLKRIALDGFTLAFPLPPINVQVRARHATLNGLPPWGRSRRVPLAIRLTLMTVSAGLSAFALARLVADRPWLPLWAGAALGAGVSAALWWAVARVERQDVPSTAYWLVPIAGVFATGACWLVLLGSERLVARRARVRTSVG